MSWRTTSRKDRLRAGGVSGWEEQRRARRILERDKRTCYRCGGQASEVDHIRPISQGGTHADDNLRAICTSCHRAKTRAETARARAGAPTASLWRPKERHPGLK